MYILFSLLQQPTSRTLHGSSSTDVVPQGVHTRPLHSCPINKELDVEISTDGNGAQLNSI